ncbi:MAG: class I SAM-dependent methyltransferase [Micromonosporaceae bacterium]
MAGGVRIPGLTFGEVADVFDQVRREYPTALVDDVLAYAGRSGRRALEVGAGTGKATLAFVERGVPVVAVEPDEAMAAVLARHVAERGDVQIVHSTFEDLRPGEAFGLLYSADAWHWTQPERRWQLATQALAPGGALALFWNRDRIDDPALRQVLIDVLAEIYPTSVVADAPAEPAALLAEWPADELAQQAAFTDVVARIYPSRSIVSGAQYLTHMSTRAQIRMLDEPTRARLFAVLAEPFDRDVPLALHAVLHLARRRAE